MMWDSGPGSCWAAPAAGLFLVPPTSDPGLLPQRSMQSSCFKLLATVAFWKVS